MNKVFRFVGSFRLVVHARTLKRARQYVKDQAISVVSYRSLEYVGEGHPSDPAIWVAAVADKPEAPAWVTEPVTIPEPYYLNAEGVLCGP